MPLLANDVLSDVSYVLLQPPINAVAPAVFSAGVQTITPTTTRPLRFLYVGARIIFDLGNASQETITVSAVTSTTFTATFANAHSNPDAIIVGAVFSKGQTTRPLYTQDEMLWYLQTGQDDFLARLRPLYNNATVTLAGSTQVFTQPADAIRLERMSADGYEVPDTSQAYLDMTSPTWSGNYPTEYPQQWYQDKVNTNNFGIYPQLPLPADVNLWYSQKDTGSLDLATALITPVIFCHYLKYYVLFRALSKDGEQRDMARAQFCYFLFTSGIYKANRFIEGIGIVDRPSVQAPSGKQLTGAAK